MRFLLLLAACNTAQTWSVANHQECSVRVEASSPWPVDVLLAIDDSALAAGRPIAADLARAIDQQLLVDRSVGVSWYHFGVITGDPADGAGLQTGCGIPGTYVDFLAGGISNLEPGLTVGETVGCLADRGASGSSEQRLLEMATLAASPDATGFRRPNAFLIQILVRGRDYGEPIPADSDWVETRVVDFANITRSALFGDDFLTSDAWATCVRPREPLEFVVTDVNNVDQQAVASVPACSETGWQPSCWELLDDLKCPEGTVRFNVRRPPWGGPAGVHTQVSYDCELLPESR